MFFLSWLAVGQTLAFFPGETKIFNVNEVYDSYGRNKVSATLRYMGERTVFFIDDGWWNVLTPVDLDERKKEISNLLTEFDQTIYPRLTQIYGSEWSPGIDGETRLQILIAPMKKITGGYFNAADEYPRNQSSRSNEGEIIYLNAVYLDIFSARVFLAHEFTHMINFYQKDKLRGAEEEVWLNEARAEYAATLCGYDWIFSGSNLERRVRDFLRSPTESLTEWSNQPSDYGMANLFMQYFAARYGESALTRTIQSDKTGIASFNEVLSVIGSADRFEDIFVNWVVANYVNDCQLGDGRKFCYLNPLLDGNHFRVNPLATNFLTVKDGAEFSFADVIKDWSGRWYEIMPSGEGWNLKLDFQGWPAGDFRVPVIIFYKSANKELRFLKLNSEQFGQDLILNFGNGVAKVVLMVVSKLKSVGFTAGEETRQFAYSAGVTAASSLPVLPAAAPFSDSQAPPPASPVSINKESPVAAEVKKYSDGSLLRAAGQARVYVVSENFRRWLRSPEIFAAYRHLDWRNIIEVSQKELDGYADVWLIRAEGDFRVYEINGDGTKHWLNMSSARFSASGRQWNMVQIVNQAERDWYKTGADALK